MHRTTDGDSDNVKDHRRKVFSPASEICDVGTFLGLDLQHGRASDSKIGTGLQTETETTRRITVYIERFSDLPEVCEVGTFLGLDLQHGLDGEDEHEEHGQQLAHEDVGAQSAQMLVEAQGLQVPPHVVAACLRELGPHAEESEEVGVGVVETQLHEHRSRLQVQPTLLVQLSHCLQHDVSVHTDTSTLSAAVRNSSHT